MNNLKKGAKVFMAFAAGSESKESNRKLYMGIAPVFVTAVNPNKEVSFMRVTLMKSLYILVNLR